MAAKIVVFDFDSTIIDIDSDNWVIDSLGFTRLFEELIPTMPWNSLMDKMMREVHLKGRTIEEIAECLQRVPLDLHVISAIKSAHSLGCDLRLVSDANMFFIETVLKHHGVLECFNEIHTNPSYVDEDGRLRISPHHDFTTSSHGCINCPPNMCKAKIMEQIQASEVVKGKKQFIYLGDGKGDFCPSLKLSENDYVMPRKDYPFYDLIAKNIELVKAEVHAWSNGEELERSLLELIMRNSLEVDRKNIDEAQLLSLDCKV